MVNLEIFLVLCLGITFLFSLSTPRVLLFIWKQSHKIKLKKGFCVKNEIEAVASCYVGIGNNILNNGSTVSQSQTYGCGAIDVGFCQVY